MEKEVVGIGQIWNMVEGRRFYKENLVGMFYEENIEFRRWIKSFLKYCEDLDGNINVMRI